MSSILVRESAESRDLTTLAAASHHSSSSDDELIKRLISESSALVEDFCDRVFAREQVTETLGMDNAAFRQNDFRIMLERTPILMIEEVRYDGDPVDLDTIILEDDEAGFLFRRETFASTAIERMGVAPIRTRHQDPLWEVDYVGGFILPSFPKAKHTFEVGDVNTTDNEITVSNHCLRLGDPVRFLTTGTLPAPLKQNRTYFLLSVEGDVMKVTASPGGTPLDAVIELTDGGTGTHTIERQVTLPASLEGAVIQSIELLVKEQKRDLTVASEKLGDYSVTYAGGTSGGSGGLPPALSGVLASRLSKYRHIA